MWHMSPCVPHACPTLGNRMGPLSSKHGAHDGPMAPGGGLPWAHGGPKLGPIMGPSGAQAWAHHGPCGLWAQRGAIHGPHPGAPCCT